MNLLKAILILLCFASCNNSNSVKERPSIFQFTVDTIGLDIIPKKILFIDSTILAISEDTILCYNHSFELDSLKTHNINLKKFDRIHSFSDTIFALKYSDKNFYYLDRAFKWNIAKKLPINKMRLIYEQGCYMEDNTYYIYSCCNGRFGGMLYFEHKQTGRLTAASMSCVTDIFKYNNAYYVNLYLAHTFLIVNSLE